MTTRSRVTSYDRSGSGGGGGGGPTTGSNNAVTASNVNVDDEDEALDPSEQTNRPIDNAIHQQRVQAWHPILDPLWCIIALFYLGAILVPTGFKIDSIQENIVELIINYDDYKNYTFDNPTTEQVVLNDTNLCGIGNTYNANRTCNLTYVVPKFMNPPILIHYQITNFHQNHRNYFKSRDPYQLLGQVGNQDPISASDCKPLNILGNTTLNPCGLIANTLFNDYFTLLEGEDIYGNPLVMNEEGITWQSDLLYKYKQPDGFNYSACPNNTCDASCCLPGDSCTTPYYNKQDNTCYRYYYPLDDTTQYLYETYPDIISPIEGVMNQHFMVWMRIAVLPDFRKLYGWINQPIAAGTVLTFQVNANYVVTRFHGSKSLVIGTTSIFGGKNPYMKTVFINVGYYCFIVGTLFALKHFLKPRKLADPKYLHYKEE